MKQKKQIAFFTENLYGGGVERILQIILSHLPYDKYEVTLFSIRKESISDDLYPSRQLCYRYIFSSYNEGGNIFTKLICKTKNWLKLFVYYHFSPIVFYRLFVRKRYDVSIAFIEGYATRIVAGGPTRMKKLAWIHTDMEKNHWSTVAFQNIDEEKQVYNIYDKLIGVSQTVKHSMLSLVKVPIDILYNPLDCKRIISLSQEPLPTEYSKSASKTRIVTLGSLIQIKGYDRLLRVSKMLVDDTFDFELFIIGKGSKECDFKEYIERENLQDYVKLIGYKNNPYPYLRSCDLYVCSSYAEGYNTSISEALALGKPVVSTECSGVKEQLGEHNEFGICTGNSELELYYGIKEMLKPENLKYYAFQAAKRGKAFSLDNSMKKICELIET